MYAAFVLNMDAYCVSAYLHAKLRLRRFMSANPLRICTAIWAWCIINGCIMRAACMFFHARAGSENRVRVQFLLYFKSSGCVCTLCFYCVNYMHIYIFVDERVDYSGPYTYICM